MNSATPDQIISRLIEMAGDRKDVAAQRTLFGMDDMRVLGISHDQLSALADEIGRPNHPMATALWWSDILEAKMLACLIADPNVLTLEKLSEIARGIKSWVLIDYSVREITSKTPHADQIAVEWSESDDDFHIYAGFKIISNIATRRERVRELTGFFDRCLFTARKQASRANSRIANAVSHALKMIGYISSDWHEAAVETCREIAMQDSKQAKWVASQTLGDLLSSGASRAAAN